jgi:hypothetical protein
MYQDTAGVGIAGTFVGGIAHNLTISGLWSDVPYSNDVEGHGEMVWKVSKVGGKLALVVVSQTGGAAVDQIVLVKRVTPTG